MNGSEIKELFRQKFTEGIKEHHNFRGDNTMVVDVGILLDMMSYARQDPALKFNMLVDVCGVDYLERIPRFEVVYHLLSIEHNHRLRIRVGVSEETLLVPSVVSLWPSANWYEREIFDLFGIRFNDHPNLRRILTHDDFEGHALRKDYPVNRRPPLHEPSEDLLTLRPYKV